MLWIIVAAFSMIWMPTALGDRFDTLWSLRPSDLVDASTLVPYTIFATSIAAVFEFFWLITEGATPGKQLVGLYVAELDGDREALAPVPALRRNIHRIVYLVPWLGQIVAIVLVAVSLASMARHDDQRSIMDLAAATRVRKLPAGSPRWSPWVAVVAMIVVACAALSQAIEWAA